MFDQFYRYLSIQIIEYFNSIDIKNGLRFDIQFQNEEQVQTLYDHLKAEDCAKPFLYQRQESVYETYTLNIKGIQVIVAATINQITGDYLTLLRNKVGTDDPLFKNTAILFIHHSNLDSIIKGSQSFYREGMPFHPKSVQAYIEKQLNKKEISNETKRVISFILEKNNQILLDPQTALLEYRDLLEVMQNKGIPKERFKSFGLFYDDQIENYSDREYKKKLEENYHVFSQIANIHQYDIPEHALEKDFDKKGITLLSSKDWEQVLYKDVSKSMEEKNSASPLYYIESNHKQTEEGVIFWEKAQGTTAAGARIRNIIVFNHNKLTELNMEFEFDQFLKKQYVDVSRYSSAEAEPAGKRLRIKIKHQPGQSTYSRVRCKGSRTYDFRIITVECEEQILENIKNNYSLPTKVKDPSILVNLDQGQIKINPKGIQKKTVQMTDIQCNVVLESAQEQLILEQAIHVEEDDAHIQVKLQYQDTTIPIELIQEVLRPKPITGLKIWKQKRERESNFDHVGDGDENHLKLIQGTETYSIKNQLNEVLLLEKKLIDEGSLYFLQSSPEHLLPQSINVEEDIITAYESLIQYYRDHEVLPTLAYMNEDLQALGQRYVMAYLNAIDGIEQGGNLGHLETDLIKVGTIKRQYGQEEILFTPLHPLNIGYQLILNEKIGSEQIDEGLLKKLQPTNLLPYIYDERERVYVPIDQNNAPEWTQYLSEKGSKRHSSYQYVPKIIEQRIRDFVNQFSYLFSMSMEAPIKINLVNTGDCKEVLQGLLNYYGIEYKKGSMEEMHPVELNIYLEQTSDNIFEEISLDEWNAQKIEEKYNITIYSDSKERDDFFNIFQQKVKVYLRNIDTDQFEYAHLCFYQMREVKDKSYRNMENIKSGMGLGGLVSGVSSTHEDHLFITGFGANQFAKEINILTKLAMSYNALARSSYNSDPYNSKETIVSIISNENTRSLEEVYKKSHWITFINPRVDMSFFKENQGEQRTLIHYSDQYTSSAGYDAITITQRSDQYKKKIEAFLKENNITMEQSHRTSIIELSNALNGQWMLNVRSGAEKDQKESMAMISSVKLGLTYLAHKNIIWIPISIEELLRVTDGIDIKANKGLLKANQKQVHKNDLLFVGIEGAGNDIQVHYYPIRVDLSRKHQLEDFKTKKLLMENLKGNGFKDQFYRHLIMQIALTSAEHMLIYNINGIQDLNQIFDPSIREKLLNDQYKISDINDEFIGEQGLILVEDTETSISSAIAKGTITLKISEQDLFQMLTKEIKDTFDQLHAGNLGIQPEDLLWNRYEPVEHEQQDHDHETKDEEKNGGSSEEQVTERQIEEVVYSALIYKKTVNREMIEVINYYLHHGVKVNLITADTRDALESKVEAEENEKYATLQKQYLLGITYKTELYDIGMDEFIILDGKMDSFPDEVKQALECSDFNMEQYSIEHANLNTNMFVKAGAGTGKTKVMIDRIMFVRHMDPTINFSEIVMITFTNEATTQMRQRLNQRLAAYYDLTKDHKYLQWIDELTHIKINTIHSFAMDTIKVLGTELNMINPTIRSYRYEKRNILERLIDSYSKEFPDRYSHFKQQPQYLLINNFLKMFEFFDNRGIDLESYKDEIDFGIDSTEFNHFLEYILLGAAQQLNVLKKDTHALEVNDLIKKLREMKQIDQIKENLQIRYLMVDEFQDTDEIQVNFIGWLVNNLQSTLFVVGDKKQSIYRFRGADYTAFNQLEKVLQSPKLDQSLQKNYRSEKSLLNDINFLFGNIDLDVMTFSFDPEDRLEATYEEEIQGAIHYENYSTKAGKINFIKKIYDSKDNEESMAILVRDNKAVRDYVRQCEELDIPCVAEIKGDFYRHRAVREFYMLVRTLLYPNNSLELISLNQTTAYGDRSITNNMILQNFTPDWDYVKGLVTQTQWYEQLSEYRRQMDLKPVLQVLTKIINDRKPHVVHGNRYYNKMYEVMQEELEELRDLTVYMSTDYEINLYHLLYIIQKTFSDGSLSLDQLEQFLKIQMATNTVENVKKVSDVMNSNILRCMTVHKSKGLEFDHVILPEIQEPFVRPYNSLNLLVKEMNNGYQLGYKMKLNGMTYDNNIYSELNKDEEEEIIGEETRLFYVAVTRAKKQVYIVKDENAYKKTKINTWQDLAMRGVK